MSREYVQRNRRSFERLQALVARLTPSDLDRPLGDGWTVGAALAHLGFWDRYILSLLDRWEQSGFEEDTGFNLDHSNNAALPDWVALPTGYVTAQVIDAAVIADRRAAGVADALAEAIAAGGMPRVLDRSVHRLEHVEQIERSLTGAPSPGGST